MVSPSRKPCRTTEDIENAVNVVAELCTKHGLDRQKSRAMIHMARWIGRQKEPPTLIKLERKFGPWGVNVLLPFLMHNGILRTSEAWHEGRPTLDVDYGKEE
jgi:hypothetical protein